MTIVVKDPLGIHARPAASLSVAISKIGARVLVRFGDRSADPKSIIQMLALGATFGSELTLEIEGNDQQVQEVRSVVRSYL